MRNLRNLYAIRAARLVTKSAPECGDQRLALDLGEVVPPDVTGAPGIVPPEVTGAPGVLPLLVPDVPGVIPPEVEGEPAVGWGMDVPGVVPPEVGDAPGMVLPEVTGAPGRVPVPAAPVAPGTAGTPGEPTTLGASARSLRTSSWHGADGSVFSVAPVHRLETRSASTPGACAKTEPPASRRAIDIARVAAGARICRLLFTLPCDSRRAAGQVC